MHHFTVSIRLSSCDTKIKNFLQHKQTSQLLFHISTTIKQHKTPKIQKYLYVKYELTPVNLKFVIKITWTEKGNDRWKEDE